MGRRFLERSDRVNTWGPSINCVAENACLVIVHKKKEQRKLMTENGGKVEVIYGCPRIMHVRAISRVGAIALLKLSRGRVDGGVFHRPPKSLSGFGGWS